MRYADLLVQVVDFSDEHHKQQMEVTEQTLKELEAGDIPQIIVYNKADKCRVPELPKVRGHQIYMSAVNDIGVEELTELIKSVVYADNVECTFLIPYAEGSVASFLMENATVLEKEYREDGLFLRASCHCQDAARYGKFRIE